MSNEKIFDPSKLPLDKKRQYIKEAIIGANTGFIANLSDDMPLESLFFRKYPAWKDYLQKNLTPFNHAIITKTIGTVLRIDSKRGVPTTTLTLGQVRGLDAKTLVKTPGIGEFQADLIVNLFKRV